MTQIYPRTYTNLEDSMLNELRDKSLCNTVYMNNHTDENKGQWLSHRKENEESLLNGYRYFSLR